MNLLTKIYKIYNHHLYDYLSDFRGFTRLAMILRKLAERNLEKIESEPDCIFEREWDNLIILDSCRYDFYTRMYPDSDFRISKGSNTTQFLKENFSDDRYKDLVYVSGCGFLGEDYFKRKTGNPRDDIFEHVYEVYENCWNEEYGTVMPEYMVEWALTAEDDYPECKKIIHFMQPHWPFVSYNFEADRDLRKMDNEIREDSLSKVNGLWYLGKTNLTDREEIIEGYKHEISHVRDIAVDLAKELSGKTVITADHGELLGEDDVYGHNDNSKTKKLRKVPWDVVNKG